MKLNYEYNICDDANTKIETFTTFESINKIFYLIYINEENSIISYDLINKQIITIIGNSHSDDITSIKHYLDDIDNRDLIMTCSINALKIWNIKNYHIICELKQPLKQNCLIKYNNIYYIVSASENNPILIYDLEGNIIKQIKNEYYINNLCSFNDQENSYLITLNDLSMCSYKNFTFYKKYKEEYRKYSCPCCNGYKNVEDMIEHSNGTPLKCLFYKKDNGNIQLIESNTDYDHGEYYIKVWDFHSAGPDLVNKIYLGEINDICLINNNKLLVGCGELIKIVYLDIIDEEGEFKEEQIEVIKGLNKSEDENYSFLKIDHPSLGECLIWKIENIINLFSLK